MHLINFHLKKSPLKLIFSSEPLNPLAHSHTISHKTLAQGSTKGVFLLRRKGSNLQRSLDQIGDSEMVSFVGLCRLRTRRGQSLLLQQTPLVHPSQLSYTRGIATKLFVAGLSFYTNNHGLSEAFSQFGQVIDAKIVMDRDSGRSKGFGFVTYASDEEAEKAVSGMNGKVLNGRVIYVEISKPRQFFKDLPPIARGPPNAEGSS
ncbi:uncharacterized protein LOC144700405 [Wolffia australiana]